ncbi:MAG: hypothetical protein RRC07_11680 [Anaerolineae bacterium]|nr:hypothetical protein [Anaerolineae bacterium]
MSQKTPVYLETGKKRTFAGALDWPGWNRLGRTEEEAVQALLDAAPRYARTLAETGLDFTPPTSPEELIVVERLEGTTTTDFGAPDAMPAADRQPLDGDAVRRFETLLGAYWEALATAAQAATGKELRKGPLGGGRDLDSILEHVFSAEAAYLRRLGWKPDKVAGGSWREQIEQLRQAEMAALAAGTRGELPERGPRGGKIWPPRYFVRRAGWHILDHAWEIEDRVL